jgi:antirestriction protein ArdC
MLPHAEALIAATDTVIRVGGDMAFYSPPHDVIQVDRPISGSIFGAGR